MWKKSKNIQKPLTSPKDLLYTDISLSYKDYLYYIIKGAQHYDLHGYSRT